MLYLVKGLQTGLVGPLPLNYDQIASAIRRVTAGVYAIGHVDSDDCFYIERVGRSDSDIRRVLQETIGTASHFKYLELPTADQAFAKECLLFHDFKPPGNRCHPEPPFDSERDCPRCFFPFRGG
ncbi:MAG: hypothetical protein ACOYLQ_12095 [Hyphomicrobiaceae bacterium]